MSAYEPLVRGFAEAVAPLTDALGDRDALGRLLSDLGWDEPVDDAVVAAFAALLPMGEALAEVPALVAALDAESGDRAETLSALAEILADVAAGVAALRELDEGAVSALPGRLSDPATWSDIGAALFDLLFVRWLEENAAVLLVALRLTGLCVDEPVGRTSRPRLVWSRLGTVASDPTAAIAETVGWGDTFNAWGVQLEVARLLARLGLRVRNGPRRQAVAEALAGRAVERVSGVDTDLVFLSGSVDGVQAELGLILAATSEDGGAMLIGNLASGAWTGSLPLYDDWTLVGSGALDGEATVALRVTPGSAEVVGGDVAFEASLEAVGKPAAPWTLLGSADGTRIELDGLTVGVGLAGTTAEPEGLLWLRSPTSGLRVVLDFSDGDGFLRDALGDGVTFAADLDVRWSSVHGVSFAGGIGTEVTIPVDVTVGPLSLTAVDLVLRASADGLEVEATVDGGFDVGVFAASATGIGAALQVTPGGDGPAGLDAALAFVPPTGVGLSVDVACARGGGFLYLDAEKGEYAGVLDLQMAEVGITAIGMLVTRLPGGVPGWSLFFSLSATFTGIQLGFGFTLNGVGGIIGVNRGLDEDALADGVRTGALDSILFPEDPVADAARILADLDAVFPVAVGQYVFGPVAKIGWGSPTLIEVDLGVVFQLPEPLTVSLLGSLSALLPTKEEAVLELHVDVAGTLNLTEGTLKIDASLRDSRVLTLELTGDVAIRASFLNDPGFLVSFGGFHPAFVPPADFPTLRRLGVALDTGDALRIQLGGYFALTSNTVQFGAEFFLYAEAAGFSAEGGSSFDALIVFTPFGFLVGMKAWVSIRAGDTELLGVLLVGELSGPNAWHAVGEATFRILGVKKSLDVEATFGRTVNEPPQEVVDVAALLLEELGRESAWSALAPAGDGDAGVVCAEASSDALEVHPAGRLEIRQRLVPLDTRLDHYGNARLEGNDRFTLSGARLGAQPMGDATEAVEEWFAAAQFFELADDEKLSAPSFEKMPAGLRLGDETVTAGAAVSFTCDHEVVYDDPDGRDDDRSARGLLHVGRADALERALLRGGAAAARDAAGLPTAKRASSRGAFAMAAPSFVTTAVDTGLASGDIPGASFYAARDRGRAGGGGVSRVVIPSYELELMT